MKLRRTVRAAEPAEPLVTEPESDPRRPPGKGRPTPKRRDADPRARGPVPPPPTTRREAYRRGRKKSVAQRSTLRESAGRGDESALPARDRGPVRRLVRDIVDTRRSVASLFLPFAALFLAGYFIKNPVIQQYLVLAWTVFFVSVVVDSFALGRRISKLVKERFPKESGKPRGVIFYGIQRSTMIRRWRFPKPSIGASAKP